MSRNPALAKIHIAKKELCLDDDDYRSVLERITGKTSSADLSPSELGAVLEEFKRLGWKPEFKAKSGGRRAGKSNENVARLHYKIEALWRTLWHLGILEGDHAQGLNAYIKRMARVDSLRFVTPDKAIPIIEGLKDWATRDGGVSWLPFVVHTKARNKKISKPRHAVIYAQWTLLFRMGSITSEGMDDLIDWINDRFTFPNTGLLWEISDHDLDTVIVQLGAWIRSEKKGRAK